MGIDYMRGIIIGVLLGAWLAVIFAALSGAFIKESDQSLETCVVPRSAPLTKYSAYRLVNKYRIDLSSGEDDQFNMANIVNAAREWEHLAPLRKDDELGLAFLTCLRRATSSEHSSNSEYYPF